jgi:hypothetical protein
MPFWSTLSRGKRIIKNVPAYGGFIPHEMSWEELRDQWLPQLEDDGMLVGVNWSGRHAVGYDVTPQDLKLAGSAILDGQPSPYGDV